MRSLRMDLHLGKAIQLMFVALLGLVSLVFLINPNAAQAAGTVSTCDEASLTTAISSGGTVLFGCDGTITLNTTSTAGFAISTNTTLNANGHNVTISGNNTHRIFTVTGGSTTFVMTGLTLTNGINQGNYGGGIIQSSAGSLIISNTTFANTTYNNANGNVYGSVLAVNGGTANVYNSKFTNNVNTNSNGTVSAYTGARLNITNTTFISNSTQNQGQGQGGGAVYDYNGSISISGSQFLTNTGGVVGGAILVDSGDLTVANSTFANNSAPTGGAVYLSNNSGAINIVGDTFNANHSTDSNGGGGGIVVYTNANTTNISSTTFTNNTATGIAGAVLLYGGNLTIANSAVLSNTAPSGGAFYAYYGSMTVANSTIVNNNATDPGSPGGVLQTNGNGTVSFINSTITGNKSTAGYGTVLFVGGGNTISFANSIIANNGNSCSNAGATITDVGNNVQFNTTNNCVGTVGDPKLGPLQNNGGLTLTEALQTGSAAINTGSNTICAAAPVNNRDQRGAVRPQGAACDVGAFEFGSLIAYSVSANAGSGQSTSISTTFASPLVARVATGDNAPIANVAVTFTLPATGASATFAGGAKTFSGTTNASGLVTTTALTANAVTGTYTVTTAAAGAANSTTFTLINQPPPPTYKVTAISGSGQTTLVSTAFGAPLVAKVTDSNNAIAAGVAVTFTLPSTGASATFAGGSTVYVGETDSSGMVTTPALTANATIGSYTAIATTVNSTTTAFFNLTNSLAGCNSLVVTAVTDDGSGSTCGSFSYALSQSIGTSSVPVTVTFALSSGNTINFTGPLTQDVRHYVFIDGSSNTGTGTDIVILNGNSVASAGLQLEGGDSLKNLTVEHFGGTQIITLAPGNRLTRVQAIK